MVEFGSPKKKIDGEFDRVVVVLTLRVELLIIILDSSLQY